MDIHQGEFVYASRGRDAGECFIVISCEENFLYLINGKSRKVSSPKKKNIKHICFTGHKDDFVIQKLADKAELTNKEVRNSITRYKQKAEGQE